MPFRGISCVFPSCSLGNSSVERVDSEFESIFSWITYSLHFEASFVHFLDPSKRITSVIFKYMPVKKLAVRTIPDQGCLRRMYPSFCCCRKRHRAGFVSMWQWHSFMGKRFTITNSVKAKPYITGIITRSPITVQPFSIPQARQSGL